MKNKVNWLLTVGVELGELVQVGAQLRREVFSRFVKETERGDGPAAWRQNQNLDLSFIFRLQPLVLHHLWQHWEDKINQI